MINIYDIIFNFVNYVYLGATLCLCVLITIPSPNLQVPMVPIFLKSTFWSLGWTLLTEVTIAHWLLVRYAMFLLVHIIHYSYRSCQATPLLPANGVRWWEGGHRWRHWNRDGNPVSLPTCRMLMLLFICETQTHTSKLTLCAVCIQNKLCRLDEPLSPLCRALRLNWAFLCSSSRHGGRVQGWNMVCCWCHGAW